MKTCQKCGDPVPIGRQKFCSKRCMKSATHKRWRDRNILSERARTARWCAEHRDWMNQWSRDRYAMTASEWLAKLRAYQRANPEKVKAWNAKWRKGNPERVRSYKRDWKERNPDADPRYRAQKRYPGLPEWLVEAHVVARDVRRKLREAEAEP